MTAFIIILSIVSFIASVVSLIFATKLWIEHKNSFGELLSRRNARYTHWD